MIPVLPNRILIDFDGTLCHSRYVDGVWTMGLPFRAVIKKVNELAKENEVIIFTSRPREEWPQVNEWLKEHEVTYHKIKSKPLAKVYVDDRSMTPADFVKEYK